MYSINNINIGIINRNRDFDGGRGTVDNPYRIVKIRHLNNIKKFPNMQFQQENDILFTDEFEEDGEYYNNGSCWIPISDFSGSYDGQGYKIENIKSIFSASTNGVFCRNHNGSGSIKNIYFKNLFVDYVSGGTVIGGIVGRGTTSGLIEGVFIDGYLRADSIVGGIVGRNCRIKRSATNMTIVAANIAGNIVGGSSTIQFIDDCYAVGEQQSLVFHRAGIHGSTFGARIYRTFASLPLGGGNGHLRRGIISTYDGYNGNSYDCFYDTSVMGNIPSNNYDTGLTIGLESTYMKYPYPAYNGSQAYDTWDFDTVWAHDVDGTVNNGYPYLRNVTPLPDI